MKLRLRVFVLLLACITVVSVRAPVLAADSAVVIMYHRFGESTYPSTNVRLDQFEAHIAELSRPDYTVLPLPEIVRRLKAGEELPERAVGISIDDAYLSVYTEAWPRLQAANMPFTLFVAVEPVERGGGYMSWDQIRELKAAGVTIGSQTYTHLHMAAASAARNAEELQRSNDRFREELGATPDLIAYPYGEYSLAVHAVTKAAGFVAGFGQHSGVLYPEADMFYLPRFAMNENFGDLGRLKLAANALPLRITEVTPRDPLLSPSNNPPILGFTVIGDAASDLSRLACYDASSGQGKARLERIGPRVEVRLEDAFPPGRARINCTMPTGSGRWRWHGFQFFVPRS